MQSEALEDFIRESNIIEGIIKPKDIQETAAYMSLLGLKRMTLHILNRFQEIIAPDKPLRRLKGMDVYVGNHIPPPGGSNIVEMYEEIILMANQDEDPWKVHLLFEDLHPYMDGNGRTGRALWMWQMHKQGRDPFQRSFLHQFYYDTLSRTRAGIAYAKPADPGQG